MTTEANNSSEIHIACRNGNIDTVKLLIAQQCDIEARDKNDRRPIHIACAKGHLDIVKLLLAEKCDVEARDNVNDDKPINIANNKGHADIVKLLYEQKFDIEARDKMPQRPIDIACAMGHIDIVKSLMAEPCDIEACDEFDRRLIHIACANGHADIVQLLLDEKCDIEACDKKGQRPIHIACEKGHIDIVKLLMDAKCDIEARDWYNWRPIHMACDIGHVGIVTLLLSSSGEKCDIEAREWDDLRPIHIACVKGHVDIVRLLIGEACDIEARDKYHRRPINIACIHGNIDIVKLLIAAKCDVDVCDSDNWRPISMACKKGNIDIVKLLLDASCCIALYGLLDRLPIHIACREGHLDIAKLLFHKKYHIEPFATDKKGRQPINMACKKGHIDVVKFLVKKKCDIEVQDELAQRPIHVACEQGFVDIAELLMAKKCDIEARVEFDQRPIHIACEKRHVEIVRLLLAKKCDMEARDENDQRPIHIACANNNIDIVKLLIEAKCDIEARDGNNQRPIDIALDKSHIDIAKLLLGEKSDTNARDGIETLEQKCIERETESYLTNEDYTMIISIETLKDMKEQSKRIVEIFDCHTSTIFSKVQKTEELTTEEKVVVNCLNALMTNIGKLVDKEGSLADEDRNYFLTVMGKYLTQLFPHIGSAFVATRLTETILYSICNILNVTTVRDKTDWSKTFLKYFQSKDSSREMKLASAVALSHMAYWNMSVKQVDDIETFLLNLPLRSTDITVLGFEGQEIDWATKRITSIQLINKEFRKREERNPLTNDVYNMIISIETIKDMRELSMSVISIFGREHVITTLHYVVNTMQLKEVEKVALNCLYALITNIGKLVYEERSLSDDNRNYFLHFLGKYLELLFPYIGSAFVAMRLTEAILYTLCTISNVTGIRNRTYRSSATLKHYYMQKNTFWSEILLKYFQNKDCSKAMKLASAVAISNMDPWNVDMEQVGEIITFLLNFRLLNDQIGSSSSTDITLMGFNRCEIDRASERITSVQRKRQEKDSPVPHKRCIPISLSDWACWNK